MPGSPEQYVMVRAAHDVLDQHDGWLPAQRGPQPHGARPRLGSACFCFPRASPAQARPGSCGAVGARRWRTHARVATSRARRASLRWRGAASQACLRSLSTNVPTKSGLGNPDFDTGSQVTVGEEGFFDANGPNADMNPWGLPNNVQVLGSRWCAALYLRTTPSQGATLCLGGTRAHTRRSWSPQHPGRAPCMAASWGQMDSCLARPW